MFDVNGINTEIVRSRMALFDIKGQAGEVWTLDFNRPTSLQEAGETRSAFNAWASNNRTGERVAASQGGLPATLTSQLFGSAVASEVTPSNSVIEPATAAPERSVQALPQRSTASSAPATLPHDEATMATLKQLWQMLSPESQAEFGRWVHQQ